MAIKTIPLSRLATDLTKTLTDCAESEEALVVEMPDQRLLAIQALVAKSKASPRKPFPISGDGVE